MIAGKFKKKSQKRSLKITLLIDLRIVEMTFSKNLPLKIMHMVLTLILNDSLHLFLFSNILKNIFTFCVLFFGPKPYFLLLLFVEKVQYLAPYASIISSQIYGTGLLISVNQPINSRKNTL